MNSDSENFWQHHSLHYLEMAFSADRLGTLANPDGHAKKTGDCGDTVEFFLAIREDTIQSISFVTQGCMNTNACANTVASMVENKHIDEAWGVTPEKVVEYLETLPAESVHCAELSVGTLYLALTDYQKSCQAPWKKLYQK
ncbi:iron-sulfur cluster assembly scaffold protein [Desulfobacterales bacterium HSG17]|nr:iron-sulfur cluster assembly scaffold protein [Desulfobacterales bacterium HSG17]